MRVYLIGYMYSGKTTIGRKLAERLGYQFFDTDQFFESYYRTSITLFFKRYGEEAFRKLEQRLLHTTANLDNAVISTGGGTPCYFDNLQWINQNGVSVYFDVSMEALLHRIEASKRLRFRPVLADKTEEERAVFVRQQLDQRLPYYRKAKIIFPADHPDIAELVRLISSEN